MIEKLGRAVGTLKSRSKNMQSIFEHAQEIAMKEAIRNAAKEGVAATKKAARMRLPPINTGRAKFGAKGIPDYVKESGSDMSKVLAYLGGAGILGTLGAAGIYSSRRRDQK